MASSGPSRGSERSFPSLLPHPPPHSQIATLMETLIKEHDGVHNNAVLLGNELVAEQEARRAMETRAEVL